MPQNAWLLRAHGNGYGYGPKGVYLPSAMQRQAMWRPQADLLADTVPVEAVWANRAVPAAARNKTVAVDFEKSLNLISNGVP